MSVVAGIAFALAALCLVAAMHPFLTYPLSLWLLAWWRPVPVRLVAGGLPRSVSVCVCAYNEQAVIGDRLRNILALRDSVPGLECLVYVDGATDNTAEIVRGFGDAVTLVDANVRHGKTHGMNTLVAKARGDIVVFTDANVSFAPDAVARLMAPFADLSVGCVCGHLRYANGSSDTAAAGSLYWRLEERIKALESATGSVMGADGSIFAIRRALHVPPPDWLIDDMYVSLALLCGGARVVRAADAVAHEAAVSTSREEFRRKIRIACQAFNVHRALWPMLARLPAIELYKYVSHKVLRWMTAFSLGVAVLSGLLGLAAMQCWMGIGLMLALGVIGGSAMAISRRGAVSRLREILAAFAATGLGVYRSMRGDTFQIWTPPASARTVPAYIGEAA